VTKADGRGRDAAKPRLTGRHPDAQTVVVRLTEPAVGDLREMLRKGDPQVVRWALKKMLQLERDPECGAPLLGGLVGWRKLVIGDRNWRIVWRVTNDETGSIIVDIAEVWAVGARSDSEVYDEMSSRVATLSDSPQTTALVGVLTLLGKHGTGLDATPEPATEATRASTLPLWLRECLVHVVHLTEAEVNALSPAEAQARWDTYTATTR